MQDATAFVSAMSSDAHAHAVTKHTAIAANAPSRLSGGLRPWVVTLGGGYIYGPLQLCVQ